MMTLEDWARRSNPYLVQHAEDLERAIWFGECPYTASGEWPDTLPLTLRRRLARFWNELTYRVSLAWKALRGVDLREDNGDY